MKYLIDDIAIVQVAVDEVTYYHVELQRHDVMLAEGLPCESYLDSGNRSNFISDGPSVALHPDFASRAWEAGACAPIRITGPEVEAVRAQLRIRATHDRVDDRRSSKTLDDGSYRLRPLPGPREDRCDAPKAYLAKCDAG